MSALRLAEVTCHLGYDCSGLSPDAHELEKSLEFERAARTDFERRFDLWRQDRSFSRPFVAPDRPATAPQPDAHGDVPTAEIVALGQEHLQAHLRGGGSVATQEASSSTCYWDPIRMEWVIIGGLHVDVDGQRLTASEAVDDFETAYRAARPSVPADFDALLQELRAMPLVLFVSLPRPQD